MTQHRIIFVILLIINSVAFSQTTIGLGKVTSGSPAVVQVPLNVSSPMNNVKSILLQFSYDNSSAEFKHDATTPGSGVSNFALSDLSNLSVTEKDGLISLSWFTSSGTTLNGKLFDLDFDYLTNYTEVRFVSATIKDMQGKKLTFDLTHGSISPNTNPAIKVLYPNGGETLEVIGSPTSITWTCVNVANVKIEYTSDNGSNWQTIISSYDATKDSYSWTIPSSVNSTNCKIKISDALPSTASDESNSTFTINSTPVVTLTTPNGGEELQVGGVKTIKWTFKNVLNIKLEYTTNASAPTPTWQTIIASYATNNGSYEWIIPNTVSADCKLKITDLANPTTVYDLSNTVLTIHNNPITLTVNNVVEGHLKIIGKVVSKTAFSDKYWYWEDVQGHWHREDAKVEKDGKDYYASDTLTVNGTVPVYSGWLTSLQYIEMFISFDANVLTLDSLIPAVSDFSTMNYSVKDDTIHVVWGTNEPIDVNGKLFDLKFNYKKLTKPLQWISGGWDYDSSPVANPTTPTAVIDPRNFSDIRIERINIKNSQNNPINASNWIDGKLSISNNPAVKLLSPVGGEVWEVNDVTQKIEWASRLVTNVAIKYSTNSGTDWTTIINPTSASTGSYTWTLPNINSTTCLIHISDSDASSTNDVSGSVFTITNIKSLNLTSPDGGEIFKSGSLKNITWNCRNLSNVKIEYSINSDTTWSIVSSSTPAKNYKYEWTVPAVTSDKCRVRIREATDTTVTDKSTNLFTINNSKTKVKVPFLVQPAGTITVPINTEQVYSINYINIAVKYNTSQMTLDQVTCNSALNVGQFNKVDNNGELRIVWFSSTPIDFSGDLFTIKFKNYSGVFSTFNFSAPNQIKDSFGKLIDAEYVNGNIGTTDVEEELIPTKYSISQNYPNPFNPSTTIRYEIPKETRVNITIYNLLGQKIATLVDESKMPGFYQTTWNAANCANGIYFYSITTADFVQTKKMILLK